MKHYEIKSRQALRILRNDCVYSIITSIRFNFFCATFGTYRPFRIQKTIFIYFWAALQSIWLFANVLWTENWMCAERKKRIRIGIPRHTSCSRWKMTVHCRNSKWNKMCKCGGYRRLLPSDSFNNKNNNIIIAGCRESVRAHSVPIQMCNQKHNRRNNKIMKRKNERKINNKKPEHLMGIWDAFECICICDDKKRIIIVSVYRLHYCVHLWTIIVVTRASIEEQERRIIIKIATQHIIEGKRQWRQGKKF